jgi:flavin-dependent dehydrogenase
MSERLNASVCVIGGGPAGSSAARRLSQLGRSVVIIEKQVFPRAHLGESLSPGVLPLLDVLGLRERIEDQGFLRPEHVVLNWPPTRGYKSLGHVRGFQVDRARFDAVMLDGAREAGAHVLEGAKLLNSVQNTVSGWDLTISSEGKHLLVEHCFVIDASGRRSVMGGKKRQFGTPTLALWNYWRGCAISGDETRVEAGAEQWYWGAPLPDGSFNATVFVDPERFQCDLQRLGSVDSVYQHLLAHSELLAACLEGYAAGPTRVCDATCYTSDDCLRPDLIKVGEALFSVDPLSSQGVQVAIGTALHAAAVVHTALRTGEHSEIAEQFYRERHQEAVKFHCSTAAGLYAQVALERETEFWRQRAGKQADQKETSIRDPRPRKPITGKSRIQLAREAQISPTPCMDGDFIVKRPALVHPGLARPTVFLRDIAIAPLLEYLRTPITVDETLRAWSQRTHGNHSVEILGWLWDNGVIVEVS